VEYSDDQAVAFDAVAEALLSAGIDLKKRQFVTTK